MSQQGYYGYLAGISEFVVQGVTVTPTPPSTGQGWHGWPNTGLLMGGQEPSRPIDL